MKEEWRGIVYDNKKWPYEVSTLGGVRRSEPVIGPGSNMTYVGKILKSSRNSSGYLTVSLCRNGQRKSQCVHRLVLEAFVGPCPEGMECNHIDGIKTNNCFENLEWVTRPEQALHRARTLGKGIGITNGKSTLVEDDVLQIRKRLAKGEFQKDIAADYGVGQPAISSIHQGKTWRHVL